MGTWKTQEAYTQIQTEQLKKEVEKKAWIAFDQHFDGKGNGPEAKIAAVVVTSIGREKQSKNNERSLDLIEEKMKLEKQKLLEE